ncbi:MULTISPECIES: TlpA disulfide reductase family protein [unclassified Actinopolyspora]|uniref:TlpA family protein disulfide reductase n=1 Tax=unclassified Actinopolyspora TaxID=2639451 RepID=UPI0013F5BA68|nr:MULTISPECIES: TlpA disulfide reductase family protein [unclassified Actinopolyspora]NHD16494.1 TlpA family protein disulfide reductase [Actinopolyspora sp. BKK2]NHE75643.1 TlpA family protein disulfide reductase [Actinopolyspora sp. BKK1]
MKSNRRRLRAGRRWLVLATVALLGLLSGCAGGDGSAVSENGEFTFVSPGGRTRLFYPPDERGRVTGLKGDSLENSDRRIRLSDFEGEVVVLNIWGSWCPPCRAEAEDLQAVQDTLGDQGVQLLGIDVRDNRNAAQDFVNNFGVTYPSIFDPSGRAMLALDGFPRSTTPATVVLDREHRVAAIYLTAITKEELLPKVRDIANEGAGSGSEKTGSKGVGSAEQESRAPGSGGTN